MLGDENLLCSKCQQQRQIIQKRLSEPAAENHVLSYVTSQGPTTPLHYAAYIGHRACVQTYCLSNAGDIPQTELDTALLLAASQGSHDVTQTLVNAGADANVADDKGRTALLCALLKRDSATAESLLRAGADPNLEVTNIVLRKDFVSPDRCTPLILAMNVGDVSCIRALVQHGGRFYHGSGDCLWPCLHSGKYSLADLRQVITMIWETEARVDDSIIDYALFKGDLDMVRYLLEQRVPLASAATWGPNRNWMLHTVINCGDAEKLSALVQHRAAYGFQMNRPNEEGYTPLLEALVKHQDPSLRTCQPAVVRLLLQHGADPDQIGYRGPHRDMTPVYRSVQLMADTPSAMHILVALLRHSSNLEIRCPRLQADGTPPRNAPYVTAMDSALLSYNLSGARALALAGAEIHDPVSLKEPSAGPEKTSAGHQDPIGLVRCTEKQRATFIRKYQKSPRSLTLLCRQKIRCVLGKRAHSWIPHLPVPHTMTSFLNYSDLDAMADYFRTKMLTLQTQDS